MPLVKDGHYIDDPFVSVADDAELPVSKPAIVSLTRFTAEKDALLARTELLGVRLEAAESPESLGDDVHKLGVVVLVIPYFRDGRANSWARILRTRMGFKGEIRVTGHYLRDQIAFLSRVGVNAFELSQNLSPADVEAAKTEITNVYQPSVDGRKTIFQLRRAGK